MQSRTSSLRPLLRMMAWRDEWLSNVLFEERFRLVFGKQRISPEVARDQLCKMAENPTATTPRKSVASKYGVYGVCRSSEDNNFRRNILLTFTGLRPQKNRCFKSFGEAYWIKIQCDIEDGMSLKACRPCYDKPVMKFKNCQGNFRKFYSNGQWYGLSAVRVKATVLHSYLEVTQESWPVLSSDVPSLKSESIFIFFHRKADLTCPINLSVRIGKRSRKQ